MPGSRTSNPAPARCNFPTFPLEAAVLASPQLTLPRQRVESVSNFFHWQRNGEYEDSQGTGNMASIFLENDHLFVLSPWNLERMSWILFPHQAPGWPYPETLTPGGKERSVLSIARSLPPKLWVSEQILLSHFLPGFMSRLWEKIPQINHMPEL